MVEALVNVNGMCVCYVSSLVVAKLSDDPETDANRTKGPL
jgi:hypothetical protein